jgi:hypothetical protein
LILVGCGEAVAGKAWMPAFAGMTGKAASGVNIELID